MHDISSDASARCSVECITSGEITPATNALATLPMQACSDEAMPRRSGAWSSTSSVTTGTISAQPNEKMPIGGMAHQACAVNSELSTRLITAIVNMIVKPMRIWRARRHLAGELARQERAAHDPADGEQEQEEEVRGRGRCSRSPRNTGADRMYRNMPLNGTPEASASARKRGLENISQ